MYVCIYSIYVTLVCVPVDSLKAFQMKSREGQKLLLVEVNCSFISGKESQRTLHSHPLLDHTTAVIWKNS